MGILSKYDLPPNTRWLFDAFAVYFRIFAKGLYQTSIAADEFKEMPEIFDCVTYDDGSMLISKAAIARERIGDVALTVVSKRTLAEYHQIPDSIDLCGALVSVKTLSQPDWVHFLSEDPVDPFPVQAQITYQEVHTKTDGVDVVNELCRVVVNANPDAEIKKDTWYLLSIRFPPTEHGDVLRHVHSVRCTGVPDEKDADIGFARYRFVGNSRNSFCYLESKN